MLPFSIAIYHRPGYEEWVTVNGKTIKNVTAKLWILKWRMIKAGAKREFEIYRDGEVFEWVHI